MQHAALGAQAPQWARAHLVGGGLPTVLDNPIASAHVVQQEVAIRMYDFAAQSRRHRECTTVDHRSGRCSRNGVHVADIATDVVEQARAGLRIRGFVLLCSL